MKTILIVVIPLLFLAACISSEKKTKGFDYVDANKLTNNTRFLKPEEGLKSKIVIKEFDKKSSIYLPEIIDTVYGVKLDNHPNALIGAIDKMRLTTEAIYLLDKYYSKSVKKFDRSGKFIATIGKHGKGPGEYYEPTDFSVTDNGVIIYDQFKRVLNFYNLEGEFIKDKAVPFIAISFHSYNDTTFVFHTLDSDNYHVPKILDYSLLWVDSVFTIQYGSAYREKDKYSNYLSKNDMDFFNNKLYYHEPHGDTVYRISPEAKIYYDYVFSFPNNQLPHELLLKENDAEFIKLTAINSDKDYAVNWNNPIIADDFLYTTVSVNSRTFTLIYSNRTSNTKVTHGQFENGTTLLFRPFSNILNCEGNVLVGYQNALELYSRIEELKHHNDFDSLPADLRDYVKDIDKNDNPILVFYELKEF